MLKSPVGWFQSTDVAFAKLLGKKIVTGSGPKLLPIIVKPCPVLVVNVLVPAPQQAPTATTCMLTKVKAFPPRVIP
jgi:hypothetical protein